jgi:hypothetical protein
MKISKFVESEDSFDKNFSTTTESLEVRERNETFSENFSNFVWWLKAEWILENDLFVVVDSLLIIYFSDEAFVSTIQLQASAYLCCIKPCSFFALSNFPLREMCETFSRRCQKRQTKEKSSKHFELMIIFSSFRVCALGESATVITHPRDFIQHAVYKCNYFDSQQIGWEFSRHIGNVLRKEVGSRVCRQFSLCFAAATFLSMFRRLCSSNNVARGCKFFCERFLHDKETLKIWSNLGKLFFWSRSF